MIYISDATPPTKKKNITGTEPHHQIANNYRQLLTGYGSLPTSNGT